MPTLLAEQITGRALSGFLSLIAATLLGLAAVQYGTELSIIDHRVPRTAFFVPPYFARPVVNLNEPAVLRTDKFGNALTNLTVMVSTKHNITEKFRSQPEITIVVSDRDVTDVYNSRTANISIHQQEKPLDVAHQEPAEETTGASLPVPPSTAALWHKTLDIVKSLIKGLLTFLFAFGPDWAPVAREAWCIINQKRSHQLTQLKRMYNVIQEENHSANRALKKIKARIHELEKQSQKAEAENQVFREELVEARTRLEQAEAKRAEVLEKTQDLVHDLQSQIEDHVKRSQQKSDELANKEGQIVDLEWDNEKLIEEKSRQRQELERLSRQLEECEQNFQRVKEEKVALKEANQRAEQAKKEVTALSATTIKRQEELITEQRKVIEANKLSLPPSGVRNSLTTGIKRGPPMPPHLAPRSAPHLAPRSSSPPPNAPTGPRAQRPSEPPSSSSSSLSSPSALPPPPVFPFPSQASPAPPALNRPASSDAATFPTPEGGPIDIPWFTFPQRPATDSQRGRGKGSGPRGR